MATAYVVSFEHGKRKVRQGYNDQRPKITHLLLNERGKYAVCGRHIKDNTVWSFSTASFSTDLEAYEHHVTCDVCLAMVRAQHGHGSSAAVS